MKLKTFVPFLLLSLSACQEEGVFQENRVTCPEKTAETVPGLLYIKLSSASDSRLQYGGAEATLQAAFPAIDSMAKRIGATRMERLFPPAGEFEARTRAAGLHRWYIVRFDKNIPVTKAGNGFFRLPEIEYTEPVPLPAPLGGRAVPAKRPFSSETDVRMPFNDPRLADQWHYNNEGRLPLSEAGADINLFSAWRITCGERKVIVSVVDGGIDTRHEDLKANLWINEAEKNGAAGVDDDGNGYADDVYGYNFVDDNGRIVAHDHGTHVAGTVSAVNNNGIGVCGVAGGSGKQDGVLLMSSQIYKHNPADPEHDLNSTLIPRAIKYGADNGAVISQNSWGYGSSDLPQATIDAIDYFIQYAGTDKNGEQTGPMRGGIVIFAAGNDNASLKTYPAAYEKVLSVTAMAPDFKKSYYSNYGSWVDITAPGGDAKYDQSTGEDVHQVLSTLPGNQYGYMQGTSMACPHVSGIAALIVSKYGGPGFTSEMLKERLLAAVRDIDVHNPGYRGKLGKGCIDAGMALGKDEGIPPDPVTDLELRCYPTRVTFAWTVTRDEDNGVPMRYDLAYSTQALPDSLDYARLPQGVKVEAVNIGKLQPGETVSYQLKGLSEHTDYYFQLTGVDAYGNRSMPATAAGKTTVNQNPGLSCRESGEIHLTRYAIRTVLYDARDPEGGVCTVELSDPNRAAEASIDGQVVTVTIKAAKGSAGTHRASLSVTDEDGGKATADLTYTIYENRPPEVIKTPQTIRLEDAGRAAVLQLTEYFHDPDGDELIYSVIYGKSGIVTGQPEGDTLSLTALKKGETEVAVTARDPYGKQAVLAFQVIVGGSAGGDPGGQTAAGLKLYPNPVSKELNILLDTEAAGKAELSLYSTRGARVLETGIDVGHNIPARLDLSKLTGGSYSVKVKFNGTTYTGNILKL